MIKVIDLKFQRKGLIAAFLIESSEGLSLIDCGPHSTYPNLKQGIEELGYSIKDVKNVFLTHIHFDHAGASWALAKNGTKIFVHPRGFKHMHDPTRLYNSAKMIYGDRMEELWGIMESIPLELLVEVDDGDEIQFGDINLKAFHTPGHASHHIAWKINDILFTGDVAGCKLGDDGPVLPPCPPPDINIEQWKHSIQKIKAMDIETMYLAHFGKATNINKHFEFLEFILDDWSNWIKAKFLLGKIPEEIVSEFVEYFTKQLSDLGLNQDQIKSYNIANPPEQNVFGLYRYWKKKHDQ